MPRRKGDTPSRIADAARREFAEFGYAGARAQRIAQRAGVNKQLLFYYFGSKAGLYRAVLERLANEALAGALAAQAPPQAPLRLRAAVEQLFDALADRPDLVRLLIREAQQARDSRSPLEEPLARVLKDLRDLVSEGQGLGFFRDDADPDLAAEQALVLVLGYLALQHVLPRTTAGERSTWKAGLGDLLNRALSW